MVELWEQITGWVDEYTGISPRTTARIVETVALFLFYFIILRIIRRIVERRVPDAHRKYFVKKTFVYIVGFVSIITFLFIWLGGVSGLAASLGVLSAGVAIALQDPLVNLAGWFFIALRRPFSVGDRIMIGEHAGDVIDRKLFQFSIVEIGAWVDADQSTGRIIHIPNGWIFKNSTINYTQAFDFLWNEVSVLISFESNWSRAKELLSEISKRHSAIMNKEEERRVRIQAEQHNIFFSKLTPIVWTSVVDNGVKLTIRYLCKPRRRRSTESAIWEDILRTLGDCEDISFAYPTTRFFNNVLEGKPEAKAD